MVHGLLAQPNSCSCLTMQAPAQDTSGSDTIRGSSANWRTIALKEQEYAISAHFEKLHGYFREDVDLHPGGVDRGCHHGDVASFRSFDAERAGALMSRAKDSAAILLPHPTPAGFRIVARKATGMRQPRR